jgi:glycosidase
MISSMLNTRKDFTSFGRGDLNFIDVVTDNPHEILSYVRKYSDEKILVLNNLSAEKQVLRNPLPDNNLAVLNMNGFVMDNDHIILEPHGFVWILVI